MPFAKVRARRKVVAARRQSVHFAASTEAWSWPAFSRTKTPLLDTVPAHRPSKLHATDDGFDSVPPMTTATAHRKTRPTTVVFRKNGVVRFWFCAVAFIELLPFIKLNTEPAPEIFHLAGILLLHADIQVPVSFCVHYLAR